MNSWCHSLKASRSRVAVACSLLALATFCSTRANAAAPSLDQLLNSPAGVTAPTGIPEARFQALIETARTRGNAAGLAWQTQQIATRLNGIATKLDTIYNFAALMMEGNVLPPVITRAKDVYDQKNDSTLMLIGERYDIRQPPRFAYVAPNWRSYLLASDFAFDASAPALVTPENSAETGIWKKALAEGYEMGVVQANQILEENFARLKADFEGMLLYRELLRRGMVTKPYVSVGHFGVTGDKKKGMSVGESILRIQAAPEFVTDSKAWKTESASQLLRAAEAAVIDEMSGAVSTDDRSPTRPRGFRREQPAGANQ